MLDAYQICEELSYIRTWGSAEEKQAAESLAKYAESLGLKTKIESFKLNDAVLGEASLEVTKPYRKVYPCRGMKMAANCENLKKPVVFVKDTSQIAKYDLKGKIAMIQGYCSYWPYHDLVEAGCAGVIVGDGSLIAEDRDINTCEMRETLQALGKLPVVTCNIKDLFEMVQENAAEVRLTTQQEYTTCTSQNVVAKIPGRSGRTIVFTAHYDSSALSCGAWDNMSGSVGILKIAEYFAAHQPEHDLVFIWCGAEERGLNGSKAYVKKHAKELGKIDLVINLDMIGAAFGKLLACVTGEEKAVHYLEYLSSEAGKPCSCSQDVYSSDSTPFADQGIPAISFGQGNSATPIHCRYDTMKLMHRETLEDDIAFIIEFSKRMANAKVIPVKRVMPENMKESLDYYMLRKRKEK